MKSPFDRPQFERVAQPSTAQIQTQPPTHTQTQPNAARPAPGAKRILVVDDDAIVRASLAAVLECEGYEVYVAEDGHAAIQSAVDHEPDLVLLDLNMPHMDGWTAFSKLENARPLLPVIVITARPHQYQNAVKLGVDAFMEKPLSFPVLLRAIQRLAHEPVLHHTKRITNPGFITRYLDNRSSNGFIK